MPDSTKSAIRIELLLVFTGGKWRLTHPSGQYFELNASFSNLTDAIVVLLREEVAEHLMPILHHKAQG